MDVYGYELLEEKMPKHVAIIMDGNGRWAKKRMMPRLYGHRAAMKTVHNTVKLASDLGIQVLTLYAFSTENWSRSKEEVDGLMSLVVEYIKREINELHANNVILKIIGDKNHLPLKVIKAVDSGMHQTEKNSGMILNIALNYGGREEILHAIKKMIRDGIKDDEITEDLMMQYLYTANQPDPDLMIRTSGEKRLSNFLLWQNAYSEFIFDDVLWPDFDAKTFCRLIAEYQNRDRRFGAVK